MWFQSCWGHPTCMRNTGRLRAALLFTGVPSRMRVDTHTPGVSSPQGYVGRCLLRITGGHRSEWRRGKNAGRRQVTRFHTSRLVRHSVEPSFGQDLQPTVSIGRNRRGDRVADDRHEARREHPRPSGRVVRRDFGALHPPAPSSDHTRLKPRKGVACSSHAGDARESKTTGPP